MLHVDPLNQPHRPVTQDSVEALKVLVLDLADAVIKLKLSDRLQRNFLARDQVYQLLSLQRDRGIGPAKQRPDDISYRRDTKNAYQEKRYPHWL